jgi:hypothetical protein
MKKTPCVFVRNFDARPRIVTREVTPGCEWVLAGEGVATRKWDGTATMIKDERIYARYDCKRGKTPPAGAIPCDPAPDEKSGHWPHWVPVGEQPEYQWHATAFLNFTSAELGPPWSRRPWDPLLNGTYELVGPKIGANPEGYIEHVLIPHGIAFYRHLSGTPITFDDIEQLLSEHMIEGLVFHHAKDDRMAKIRRGDFGLPWPVPGVEPERVTSCLRRRREDV